MKEVQPKTIEQDIEVYIEVHPCTDKDFDQTTERAIQQLIVCLLHDNLRQQQLPTTTEKPSTLSYTDAVTAWVKKHG